MLPCVEGRHHANVPHWAKYEKKLHLLLDDCRVKQDLAQTPPNKRSISATRLMAHTEALSECQHVIAPNPRAIWVARTLLVCVIKLPVWVIKMPSWLCAHIFPKCPHTAASCTVRTGHSMHRALAQETEAATLVLACVLVIDLGIFCFLRL